MNNYLVHYYSKTLASLSGRNDHQEILRPMWKFVFQHTGVVISILDRLEVKNELNLHRGIDIIIQISANTTEEVEESSKNYAETVLNLITYVTQSYCGHAQLVSVVNVTDISSAEYKGIQMLFADKTITLGSLRIIEQEDFSSVFQSLGKTSHEQRIIRAMSWLRKGINEENDLDEFIAYWTGLEVLKGVLRKEIQEETGKKPDEWEGLRNIFLTKVNTDDFENIKNARNEILHGATELSHDFVRKIKKYVIPTREALIYSIGKLFLLEEGLVKKLVSQGIRRSTYGIWTVYGANIKNLPTNLDAVIANFPVVTGKIESEVVTLKNNKISYAPRINYNFSGPAGSFHERKYIEFRGDEHAGAEPTGEQPKIIENPKE